MKQGVFFLFCAGLVVIVILVGTGIYAAWHVFTVISTVLLVVGGVAAVIFLGLCLYRFYLHSHIIRPGRHGAAQAIYFRGEIYELGVKPQPTRKMIEGSVEISQVEEQGPPALPPTIPTFTDLLKQNIISTHKQLVIGVRENGELRLGSWLDLYTLAVAGVQGTGKSTSVLFFLLQAVLHNARLVMIDPHIGKPDSLARRLAGLPPQAFMQKPAVTNQEILQRVRWTANELQRRKKPGQGYPLILVIDEFTKLMRTKEIAQELGALLEAIAQEGRGYNIFALLTGQVWTATRTGGTELRYSIASSLVHRIQENQAALLIPRRHAKVCPELETGQALLYDTNGQSEILRIPLTTVSDVAEVAALLTSNGFPPSFQAPSTDREVPFVEATQEGEISEREVTTEGLPEVHQFDTRELEAVTKYVAEAKSPHEIVGFLWHVTGGREYQEKKLLVQHMTAYLVKQARKERVNS